MDVYRRWRSDVWRVERCVEWKEGRDLNAVTFLIFFRARPQPYESTVGETWRLLHALPKNPQLYPLADIFAPWKV